MNSHSEFLISAIDRVALYLVPGNGIYISPFGEQLAQFLISLIGNFPTFESKSGFYTRVIRNIPKLRNALPSIFVLQGLASAAESQKHQLKITDTEINALTSLYDLQKVVSIYKRPKMRLLIRKFSIIILVNITHPSDLNFDSYSKLLAAMYSRDDPLVVNSPEFEMVRCWNAECTIWASSISNHVSSFLQSGSLPQFSSAKAFCNGMSVMCLFLIDPSSVSSFKQLDSILLIIYNCISRLNSPYASAGSHQRVLVFLSSLLRLLLNQVDYIGTLRIPVNILESILIYTREELLFRPNGA